MSELEDLVALLLAAVGHAEPVAALRVVARGLLAEGIAHQVYIPRVDPAWLVGG